MITLHICSYKEFVTEMTSYLPVHNGYTGCTHISKNKNTLAYIPTGACKIAFECMRKCLY